MISRRRLANKYPTKTFEGRERVSLVPRWITNWAITGTVIYFMGTYLLSFFGYSGINPFLEKSGLVKVAPTLQAVPDVPLSPVPDFHASSGPGINTPIPQGAGDVVVPVVVQPTLTPYPTSTPYPPQIKMSAVGNVYAVGYSYYWPPFGPPNCSAENWQPEYNLCKDTTASGLKWSEWIGRAVAVPIQWKDDIPLGSVVRIYGNIEMQGDYLVIDYCGGCIKKEGHVYIDFLDNRQRLAWTVPLLMEVVSVPEAK